MAPHPLIAHFRRAAPALFREPAGVLRHPFVVPGSIYGRELWDWDSYWTTLGMLRLSEAAGDTELRGRALRHGRGSLLNFLEHQDPSGGLPIMMRADNPDVFGCFEPGGPERNQAKPVFARFALALAEAEGEAARDWLAEALPRIERFHAYWENRYIHEPTGLLVWGSDVGIGVDNDPSCYARPPRSSANLLLNCLHHADLAAAARCARLLGDEKGAARWSARAEASAAAIRRHCWDARDGFFYSLDVLCADHRAELIPWAKPGLPLAWSGLPIRIQLFTGFLPLWCGAASPEQATALRDHAMNPETFFAPHGLRSLSRREPMFTLARSNNPSNWLGPVWILASHLVWCGLLRYGFKAEADELAHRTVELLADGIARHGDTHEAYDPEIGAPIMNKGFLSWNILACEMLAAS
jgi:Glycogen debranching enzyme